jgi:hypothetical protein
VTRCGLSDALALRAIGQSLEARQTRDFDLSAIEAEFVVGDNKPRDWKWPRTSLGEAAVVPKAARLRKAIQRPDVSLQISYQGSCANGQANATK